METTMMPSRARRFDQGIREAFGDLPVLLGGPALEQS
jgi:hypothetical protein